MQMLKPLRLRGAISMRLTGWSILVALLMALSGAAIGGPLEDGVKASDRGDYSTALQLWLPLANQGDAVAQYLVGGLYNWGLGVPVDYAEAMKWFHEAADQGNALAQFQVGVAYAGGQGVPEDQAEALKWFHEAADQGNALAQYALFCTTAGKALRRTMPKLQNGIVR